MSSNECSRHGVCSASPSIMAYSAVLQHILEIKAKYITKLEALKADCSLEKSQIISTLSMLLFVSDYSDNQLLNIFSSNYNEVADLRNKYINHCKKHKIKPLNVKFDVHVKSEMFLSDILSQGQKIISENIKNYDDNKRCYKVILGILQQSVALSIKKLQDYDITDTDAVDFTVKTLSNVYIKSNIRNLARLNIALWEKRCKCQFEHFGSTHRIKVNTSTEKGKAILVSGSNLVELRNILDSIQDIDIYTNGNLLVAHSFEKFQAYKNLKGYFSSGSLYSDFSTFPGAIYLTQNSNHSLENIIRGNISTIGQNVPKGVKSIKDYDELKTLAKNTKGFSTGRKTDSIIVGFDKAELQAHLKYIKRNQQVYVLGMSEDEDIPAFDYVVKDRPKGTFVLSFSHKRDDLYYINIHNNLPLQQYIYSQLFKYVSPKKVTVFAAKCDTGTLSWIIYLKSIGIKDVYLSHCDPVVLSPAIKERFMTLFGIKKLTKKESL